jgi:serine/threonine protein kinase
MGEVWRAHDTDTERIVAIKLLPAHLSADEDFQRRFRREAHAAARLSSPHVIPIHHYGEIDGRLYVDMRLIEGRDLGAVLADGPLNPARAVEIIEQVAKALHAAHEVGLLHRDVKPSNVLLDRDDFAYLIDFGIARAADDTRLTKSGHMIGTFHYIAPERLDSQIDEDARADIYSLACVLYESLTGEPPFPGITTAQLIAAHLNTPPPRPSATRPNVPSRLDGVIATGMAKDPNRRFRTTVALAKAARIAIIAGPVTSAKAPASWPPPAARTNAPVPRQQQAPPSKKVAPPARPVATEKNRTSSPPPPVGLMQRIKEAASPPEFRDPKKEPARRRARERAAAAAQDPEEQEAIRRLKERLSLVLAVLTLVMVLLGGAFLICASLVHGFT